MGNFRKSNPGGEVAGLKDQHQWLVNFLRGKEHQQYKSQP